MKSNAIRHGYLREAALMLIVARLAVRLLPPAWIFGWASRRPRNIRRFAGHEVPWVAWAVDTKAEKSSLNASCLSRALAVQAMLRRRGIASRLCLGVAHEEDELVAHAWIEVGKEAITERTDFSRYTRLAQFGG
jgi:hypothetical protein